MGSILGPNRVIAKNVKSCTYCCYGRCATLIVWIGGNILVQNKRNSIPCTVRTYRQRWCNQWVGFLPKLGSRAFGPAKRSGPRLLSTVPWGMTRIYLNIYLSLCIYLTLAWNAGPSLSIHCSLDRRGRSSSLSIYLYIYLTLAWNAGPSLSIHCSLERRGRSTSLCRSKNEPQAATQHLSDFSRNNIYLSHRIIDSFPWISKWKIISL